MRPVMLFGFTSLLVLTLPCGAADEGLVPSQRQLREACSMSGSQAALNACLHEKLGDSQHAVERAESALFAAFERWDEDAEQVRTGQGRERAARQSFIEYRERQCALAASVGGGAIGHALEARRLACTAELNYQRAQQLEALAHELPARLSS
ncbi:lysozyme inhibitor LprI family protein [Metapseudomonas otitidis]|uniref:lysozyme inhibitor LprI family protein n=1 Tax=Metapseudomonas otitidis TaxID=319939 RepID=UPI0013F6919A|nr:lysozyme inhibitor LprI family protein [Pseudomonas otitidis]